ncbi:MAG: hypothetical protein Q7J85_08175, partial [Bacillota bacterium]|nr:hypothetical protein [Bacillota bacterium]
FCWSTSSTMSTDHEFCMYSNKELHLFEYYKYYILVSRVILLKDIATLLISLPLRNLCKE